jgi:lysophospholipase L1-like esterase
MTPRNPITRRFVVAAGLGICGLVLIISVIRPTSSRIDTQEREATIFFEADPAFVTLPGDCVTVRWRVENIREIYVNEQAQIGEGQRQTCLETPPILRVKFQDESESSYSLSVPTLVISPLFWLGLILLVGTLPTILSPIFRPFSLVLKRVIQSPTFRALPQKLALMAFGIFLACFMLELGLRFYFSRYGSQEDRIKYLYSLEEVRQQTNILVPMPYVNYIPSPGFPEHNSLGYRGPEFEIPKPEGIYRIVALGGSTTYGSATKPEDSYPAQLQNVLRDQYGYNNVEVINGGMVGYSSWETLVSFEFRVLELEPDMIILYDSVNDIIPREQISVDCYRGHNTLRGLNGTKGFWVERDDPFIPSALYRLVAVNLGWMQNPLVLNSWFDPPQVSCQLDDLPLDERVAQNPPIYFERNLRNTIVLAQANDVQPVLSTWAYYLEQDRPEYWREAVDENNGIIRQLADERDVPLYDLAQKLPLNREFWSDDGIHMYAPGTLEQAQEYAAFLVESDLLPR